MTSRCQEFRVLTFCLLAAGAFPSALVGCERQQPNVFSLERVLDALRRQEVISNVRVLMHISHTCDLISNGKKFLVFDVREILPMRAPRGVNQIVVLDTNLRAIHAIRYYDERPLKCEKNTLLLYGELQLESDGYTGIGNLLVFDDDVRRISAKTVKLCREQGP